MIVSDNLMVIVKKILVTGPVNNNHESRKMKKKIQRIMKWNENCYFFSVGDAGYYYIHYNEANFSFFF